ncbi:hypothetical protein AB4099_18930 [Bosea sp. 2KB_26]|uniref:hypothetical protein n=1 Tax=Bosea sp. 2KB_26 TaxID=3237475 RepID=UPI003F9311BE
MNTDPETKIKNLLDGLSHSGLVIVGLQNLSTHLARLARSYPGFEAEFEIIRDDIIREVKNADIAGPTFEAQAGAIAKALATLEEMMDLIHPKKPAK